MQMPVMDGFTATRILRERSPDLPIVALTADAMKGSEERCRQAGCVAFVPKPIDMDQLFRCLKQLWGLAEPTPPAAETIPHAPRNQGASEEFSRASSGSSFHSPQPPHGEELSPDQGEERALLESFLATLHLQLDGMIQATHERDYAHLAELAHQLQSTAPTFGYDIFLEPAEKLKQAANEEAPLDQIRRGVAHLIELSEHVLLREPVPTRVDRRRQRPVMPARESRQDEVNDRCAAALPCAATPIRSSLPLDDPDFLPIVAGFVEHLHVQLERMREVWIARDMDELARLAHWLKGAAGTVGFEAFTSPAKRLQDLASTRNENEIQAVFEEIVQLASRIESPRQPEEPETVPTVLGARSLEATPTA
jgi:CheY-like chemotaxis protein